MKSEAFSRCPICKAPLSKVLSAHGPLPCQPVEYVFGELLAVGLPRPYAGSDPRWTSRALATVALEGRTYVVECLLKLDGEFPDCFCDAKLVDTAILGRLLWPHPNTRVIAEAALARAVGLDVQLPIDLVFVKPCRDLFVGAAGTRAHAHRQGPRAAA